MNMTNKDRFEIIFGSVVLGLFLMLTNATGEFSFFVAYLLVLTVVIFFATYKAVCYAIKSERRMFYWLCTFSGVAVGGVLFNFALAVAPFAK